LHLQLIIAVAAMIVEVGLVGSYIISKSNSSVGDTYNYANCIPSTAFKIKSGTAEVLRSYSGSAVKYVDVKKTNIPLSKKTI